jgi:hypothetical protein
MRKVANIPELPSGDSIRIIGLFGYEAASLITKLPTSDYIIFIIS